MNLNIAEEFLREVRRSRNTLTEERPIHLDQELTYNVEVPGSNPGGPCCNLSGGLWKFVPEF